MTRILLVETASPQRVRKKAEDILSGGMYEAPELTILCSEDVQTLRYLAEIPSAQVVQLNRNRRARIPDELKRQDFDLLYLFWTGERRYRGMKLLALRLKAKVTLVDSGDGGIFRLTWKACIRHWQFRRAHPLPTDHWIFVPQPDVGEAVKPEYYEGEKVLVVQSAEPLFVLRALERLREKPLFCNPKYTLFCRNRPEIVRHFQDHPMIHEIRTHSETRGSWNHLRGLRKERFDAVVVFFTGDPSYWKIKWLPFLLSVRHKVVFNESNDCFYFTFSDWLALLSHRLGERSRTGSRRHWTYPVRTSLFLLAKLVLFPFRFVWLLLVWLKLRGTALIRSS